MPIISKRDIHNWYNTMPIDGAEGRKWDHFSAAGMKGNEIRCGAAIMAKIPKIPGRISRKKRKSEDGRRVTTYIELILESRYDPQKHQMRNRRVTIGIDVSHIFAGMMIINEKYHDYFDHEGKLIYQARDIKAQEEPEREDLPAAQAETEKQEKAQAPESYGTAEERPEPEENHPEEQTGTELVHIKETEGMNNEAEEREAAAVNRLQHESDHLKFLEGILHHYNESIQGQAKKRPNQIVSRYQIRRINEVLKEIKDYFRDTDISDYMELAEEPGEDGSGMAYADVEILLHAYTSAMAEFWMGTLWHK